MKTYILSILLLISHVNFAQNDFNYSLELNSVSISGLPGLHSFAFGQSDGKWLIVGGRLDGLHARQPFNAFPASNNNTSLYVVDKVTQHLELPKFACSLCQLV